MRTARITQTEYEHEIRGSRKTLGEFQPLRGGQKFPEKKLGS